MQFPEFDFGQAVAELDAPAVYTFFDKNAQQALARAPRRNRDQQQVRVTYAQQQLGPQADQRGIELGHVVHGGKGYMTFAQNRQSAHLGHPVRRCAVTPETARHIQQTLAVPPRCPGRVGVRIGQAVIHGAHAGSIRIAEEGKLQRRRFACEHQQAVAAGVAG